MNAKTIATRGYFTNSAKAIATAGYFGGVSAPDLFVYGVVFGPSANGMITGASATGDAVAPNDYGVSVGPNANGTVKGPGATWD